jgi:cellulose synthase/poly-beta-1,6-N-acetylglucosamine synthase-like glycosyltransferase
MTYFLLHTFFVLIFCFLAIFSGYLLFISIIGHVSRSKRRSMPVRHRSIAVLITSHREDEIIVHTVNSAVAHDYPRQLFDVFVAADHIQQSTLASLKQTSAIVYELEFVKGSKARSLNFLLNNIDENKYEIAVVLDGDNIMSPGFLQKVNSEFEAGNFVVQAHRTAKNVDTPIAILDALSEEVNNHLFRKAPAAVGLSSSLIGSGMSFPLTVLKNIYNKPGIVDNPACDREVDFEMLVAGYKVHYLADADILDEKVSDRNVYENQRRRWLESQWMHVKLFFSDWDRVRNKDQNFWHKLLMNLLPPRLLILATFGFVLIVLILELLLHLNITGIPTALWIVVFAAYILSIILSIPRRFFSLRVLKALFHLPSLVFTLLKATLTMKGSRKQFIHTPKRFTEHSASPDNEQ